MVDLLEGIATTRAIRRFRPDPIPDDDLAAMFFAATRAPSGSNRQGFRFVVLRDGPKATEAKALLGQAFRRGWDVKAETDGYATGPAADDTTRRGRTARALQHMVDHFEEVPVVALACLQRHRRPVMTEGASVYPACQNLLLAARALGYGGVITMWHGYVEAELRALLGIPDEIALCATIPLGKPVGGHGPVRRKPMAELIYDDAWQSTAAWVADPPGTRFTG